MEEESNREQDGEEREPLGGDVALQEEGENESQQPQAWEEGQEEEKEEKEEEEAIQAQAEDVVVKSGEEGGGDLVGNLAEDSKILHQAAVEEKEEQAQAQVTSSVLTAEEEEEPSEAEKDEVDPPPPSPSPAHDVAQTEREEEKEASLFQAEPDLQSRREDVDNYTGITRDVAGEPPRSRKPKVKVLSDDERKRSQDSRQYRRETQGQVKSEREREEMSKYAGYAGRRGSKGGAPSQIVQPKPVAVGSSQSNNVDQIVAELGAKLARQTAKLEASEKGKEELEDMLLRIEKHFKTEQMLRRKAEVALDQMRQSLKTSEMDGSRIKVERQALERQKLKNIQERTKLEEERSQMQVLIQSAGEQERKAKIELQELHHSVSTREEMITYRLQAGYSATIAKLESEIARLKEELEFRTVSMHSELQKWRQQAQFATNALREAKDEVIDRKRELDTTKERMDLLVEKLYTGRERGMELRGAIDVQIHQSQLAQDMREKFQSQQPPQMQAQMQMDLPFNHNQAAYSKEATFRLPAVDASQPQRPPQPVVTKVPQSESKAAHVHVHGGKPDQDTPRMVQGRPKVQARKASPSYSRVQPKVENRKLPKNAGYAQIHIRDSKESAKRYRGGGGVGHRTPPPSKASQHKNDRWTESNRESAMAAYAARWE